MKRLRKRDIIICHSMLSGFLAATTPWRRCPGKPSTPGRLPRSCGSICEEPSQAFSSLHPGLYASACSAVSLNALAYMASSINQLLDQLNELRSRFGAREGRKVEQALSLVARQKPRDPETLIRLHEILLFVCAYPPNARVRQLAASLLKNFDERIEALREADIDLSTLETPEVSGIAGTSVTDTFSYYIVRWLLSRHSRQINFDWDWFEDENRLAETWPRFIPLLEEDSQVEANVPYREWLCSAAAASQAHGSERELAWLIQRFDSLAKTEKEKAELYDSQKLYVRWTPVYHVTRTGMRLAISKGARVFYHHDPLIKRRDVSLQHELETPPATLKQLSSKRGATILDMARAASTVRYRELYGFTHGDPERVFQTSLGRGVDVFVIGLPPGKRLPLRAYHAAMIFKNGVPIGYFEGLSLFERMESGFNLYYTFRDGETAWLYTRVLSIFRDLLGVTAFSIDPYQVGYENEEGIESGAFWFYRKLGFRPMNRDVMPLVINEEKKLASRSSYRTSLRTLRKLAAGPMIFELDKSPGKTKPGEWDHFSVRKIGLTVQRHMAAKFGSDAESFCAEAVKKLNRILGRSPEDWQEGEQSALSDFAVTLSLAADLHGWGNKEKQELVRIVRAKARADESRYLRLMQKHARLRAAMIKLG